MNGKDVIMIWRRRLWVCAALAMCIAVLQFPASVQAFGPYKTLYVTHLDFGANAGYEFSYAGGDVQNHAFTFNAAAGEILTIEALWLTGGDPSNHPWINLVSGTPPVAAGGIYTFDYEAADIMPQVMRADQRIEDWEAPRTGTYTLHANFYPYDPGTFSLSFVRENAAPEELPTESAEGWMGEFPQIENGDHFTEGTITNSRTWIAHSFMTEPGAMLTIMAWSHDDTPADRLEPFLMLCRGGCDPTNMNNAQTYRNGREGVALINYQVPTGIPSGTLYTAVVDGGETTGDYSIWMRQTLPDDLLNQFAGGQTGELPSTEGGVLMMDGVITRNTAFLAHSFTANPGDTISADVFAKRETPADQLVPVILLVPGGYEPGEQWLAMDVGDDDIATLTVTIPNNMPPNMLYTLVVADRSNAGQLLFGAAAVFDGAGGYRVIVEVY